MNVLAGGSHDSVSALTRVRTTVLSMVITKTQRMTQRLSTLDAITGSLALGRLIGDEAVTGDNKAKKLDGMACDLLETSALVDPLKFVPADVQELLSSSTNLFPGTGSERCQPRKIPAADRDQYALLVLRQLRSGKARLRREITAGAFIFSLPRKTRACSGRFTMDCYFRQSLSDRGSRHT